MIAARRSVLRGASPAAAAIRRAEGAGVCPAAGVLANIPAADKAAPADAAALARKSRRARRGAAGSVGFMSCLGLRRIRWVGRHAGRFAARAANVGSLPEPAKRRQRELRPDPGDASIDGPTSRPFDERDATRQRERGSVRQTRMPSICLAPSTAGLVILPFHPDTQATLAVRWSCLGTPPSSCFDAGRASTGRISPLAARGGSAARL